jgi:Leucine-rich repeat (LRR) protein
MDKYKVDYSATAHFKGIRILFDHLEEGLDYAQQNSIKEVCVWTNGDWTKRVVDFDFLKDRNFIKTFHWLVPLARKSSITGLYYLSALEDLRWGDAENFDFDLSQFQSLKELNIGYGGKTKGWDKLKKLKQLQINSVKTENLSFLRETVNLEYLRIIGGSFTSISGIERCSKLKTLFLQKCTSLVELQPTLQSLSSLEQLNLEGCKKVNTEEQLKRVEIKNISVI